MRWADVTSVPLRTILVTIGILVVVYLLAKLLYRLRDVVLLMLVGGFIALVLNPLVVALQHWKAPRRGVAVGIVTLWAVLFFAGLAVAFGYPLVNSITHFANALPEYVNKAQHGKGWIGHLVRKYHIESWVNKNSPKLVSYAAESEQASPQPRQRGCLRDRIACGCLCVRAVAPSGGPEDPKRHPRFDVSRSGSQVFRYWGRGQSFHFGLRIGRCAHVDHRRYRGLRHARRAFSALCTALRTLGRSCRLPPHDWGALAGIPTVLFALGHSLTAGVVTAVMFLLYTFFENHFLNPIVMSRTVKVNPLLVFIAVLIGADIGSWVGGLFGGFVCVLLAIPVAGSIQVVVREIWRATAPEGVEPPDPPVGLSTESPTL